MQLEQEVVNKVQGSTQSMRKIWNKAVIKYIQQPGIDFVQYALPVPNYDNRKTKLCQIRRS